MLQLKQALWLGSAVLMFRLATGSALAGAERQADSTNWDNLKQLHGGEKVEVVDMDLKSLRGGFVHFSDNAICLRTRAGEVTLERNGVFRVSFSPGAAGRARNAAFGAAAGVAGALIAGRVWSTKGQPSSGGDYAKAAACAGAIGAGIGAAFPGWHTVYRAKRPRKERK